MVYLHPAAKPPQTPISGSCIHLKEVINYYIALSECSCVLPLLKLPLIKNHPRDILSNNISPFNVKYSILIQEYTFRYKICHNLKLCSASLTHLPTHPLTHPPTHTHTHAHTHTHTLKHTHTHSLTHSLAHPKFLVDLTWNDPCITQTIMT